MEKYILCDTSRANYGKSTTLKYLANLFIQRHDLYKVSTLLPFFPEYDNVYIIECLQLNKSILIQTGGDNAEAYSITQEYIKDHPYVDIIICASRTKGKSVDEVTTFCEKGYKYIEFRNLWGWKDDDIILLADQLNERFFAPMLYDIIMSLL